VNFLLAVGLSVAALCIIEGLFLFIRGHRDPEAKRIEKQLKELSKMRSSDPSLIMEGRSLSSVPWLNKILVRIPFALTMDNIVAQAGLTQPVGVYILLSIVLAFIGFMLLSIITRGLLFPIAGLCFGILPYFYLVLKKNQRIKAFEAQLPDALDLMARSLRAGHALTGGLQMVAQEFLEPLGPEFARAAAQINIGVSVEQALQNMTRRLDCQDLKFLAVSIIIQRETGGNLAEILESIAHLIREREKLRGKIRALSAEGKLSAIILVCLPFAVVAVLLVINPKYITILSEDSLGLFIVFVALLMMAVGILIIKKIISIKA
jgi:tight adherence protein B